VVFTRSKILCNEIKHHTLLNVLTCFAVFLLIYILFGIEGLKKDTVLIIAERFLPLMAIILLTPCFEYELDKGINQVIRSKTIYIGETYFIRMIWRIVLYVLSTLMLMQFLKTQRAHMEFSLYTLESISIGLFLGSLGFLISGISSSLIGGYLVALVYYLIQWMPNLKMLGAFYLFRIGKNLEPMIELNIGIALLFLISGLLGKLMIERRR